MLALATRKVVAHDFAQDLFLHRSNIKPLTKMMSPRPKPLTEMWAGSARLGDAGT
jgi:hypothetical protein